MWRKCIHGQEILYLFCRLCAMGKHVDFSRYPAMMQMQITASLWIRSIKYLI
jgi:hypothetical protein